MPKALTDTQRVILASAAARADHRVLPPPSTLNKNAGAITLCLRAALTSGLLMEVASEPGDVNWGTAQDGAPTTLVITELGLTSIGLAGGDQGEASPPSSAPATAAPRIGSKLAVLIDRLSTEDGATIDELMLATGWQKHSIRGAMSGALKAKRKLEVTSEVVDGKGRVYRIRAAGAAREPGVDLNETSVADGQ